ncbi:MAG: hypothetical protein MUF23_13485 [Pirellula sp.]|jgi:hypothetical protein|nr:hypothetical protein [Pirellula sp.]
MCASGQAQPPNSHGTVSGSQSSSASKPSAPLPEGTIADGQSSREAREAAIRGIPFQQLTPDANQRLRSVIEDASFFRRLPTQTVACDPEMYVFLVRHPEVVVSLWDVMGITKVTLERIGDYQLRGDDGAGTKCKMDLVFGSDQLHIYQSHGAYDGNLWARELRGRCVVCIHNRPAQLADGRTGMVAWMDAFLKLENVGADLAVKALGPFVSKTADHNFIECAGFFSQISQTARSNPQGLTQVAGRLPRVKPEVKEQFIETSLAVAKKLKGLRATPIGWTEELHLKKEVEGEPIDSPSLQILTFSESGQDR